jgi:hypothetical protein
VRWRKGREGWAGEKGQDRTGQDRTGGRGEREGRKEKNGWRQCPLTGRGHSDDVDHAVAVKVGRAVIAGAGVGTQADQATSWHVCRQRFGVVIDLGGSRALSVKRDRGEGEGGGEEGEGEDEEGQVRCG